MAERGRRGHVAVLSSTWGREHDELAFVMRSIAGAASRLVPVGVMVPGPKGSTHADGAFDLVTVGEPGAGGRWPDPEQAFWPEGEPPSLTLVDRLGDDLISILERFAPQTSVVTVTSGTTVPPGADTAWRVGAGPLSSSTAGEAADQGARADVGLHEVGLHVPINPLAGKRRHNGLGFTGYILVLGDRGAAAAAAPSPLARWLIARFPRQNVVVVDNAVASAWRSRSLRGSVAVDTRTDLWRLIAHALVMVDLRPGPLVARECVEALRFGTPIVVPAGTAAADLARRGGGLWYRDVAELLACVDAFGDREMRAALGGQGRAMADEAYGDPAAFVGRVRVALADRGVG